MSVAATTLTAGSVSQTVETERCENLRSILFFDGVCGLCNQAVDFVLARDQGGEIQFAPLQGDTARQLLTPADLQNLNSMVFWVEGQTYRRTSAAVQILYRLGPFWRAVGFLLWLIPLPLRNLGYALVARNRYRFFGKKETCRMPTPAERSRFLP